MKQLHTIDWGLSAACKADSVIAAAATLAPRLLAPASAQQTPNSLPAPAAQQMPSGSPPGAQSSDGSGKQVVYASQDIRGYPLHVFPAMGGELQVPPAAPQQFASTPAPFAGVVPVKPAPCKYRKDLVPALEQATTLVDAKRNLIAVERLKSLLEMELSEYEAYLKQREEYSVAPAPHYLEYASADKSADEEYRVARVAEHDELKGLLLRARAILSRYNDARINAVEERNQQAEADYNVEREVYDKAQAALQARKDAVASLRDKEAIAEAHLVTCMSQLKQKHGSISDLSGEDSTRLTELTTNHASAKTDLQMAEASYKQANENMIDCPVQPEPEVVPKGTISWGVFRIPMRPPMTTQALEHDRQLFTKSIATRRNDDKADELDHALVSDEATLFQLNDMVGVDEA